MITANQLVAHALGDYVLQSDWMASKKTTSWFAAIAHALTYALPFLVLTSPSVLAVVVIVVSHALIDHFRIARFVCWAKNWFAPKWMHIKIRKAHGRDIVETEVFVRNAPWYTCAATGYHESRPPWLSTWLMIIIDNLMHVICNAAAIQWLI